MKKLIVRFSYRFRNVLLKGFEKALFTPLYKGEKVSKVLVVRKGTLGDHIVCEPIYAGIQKYFKGAEMHLLSSVGRFKETSILSLPQQKYFKKISFFEDNQAKEHLALLKREKYDLVIELPQELDSVWVQIRNMFFFSFAGIKHGLGWTPGNSYLFAKWQYFNLDFKRIWQIHAQNLNKTLAIEFREIYSGIEETECKFELPEKYIVVCPEAKYQSKMWPKKNFEVLAQDLLSQGENVVVLGQKQELNVPNVPNYFNLVGQTNLEELQIIIKNAQLFIGNDSGPMHMAYSNQTPLIALFGTRNYPKLWWPPEAKENIVLHQPEGAKKFAFIEKGDSNNRECFALNSIFVKSVYEQFYKLLKKN